MADQILLKRGAVAGLPTGTSGEPYWTTDSKTLYVSDGAAQNRVLMAGTGIIVNADINASAAIARTKIASGTASHVIINDGSGVLSSEANLAVSRGGTGAGSFTANNVLLGNGTSAFQVVPPGTSGNILTSNGTTWTSAAPTNTATAFRKGLTSDDTGRTSTITLTAISALNISTTWAATQTYIVRGYFSVTNSNATPDCDFQLNGPTSTTVSIWYYSIRATSIITAPTEITAFATGGTAGNLIDLNAGGVTHVFFQGIFVTSGTPGSNNLSLEYAQNVSGGTATIIQRGAYLEVMQGS